MWPHQVRHENLALFDTAGRGHPARSSNLLYTSIVSRRKSIATHEPSHGEARCTADVPKSPDHPPRPRPCPRPRPRLLPPANMFACDKAMANSALAKKVASSAEAYHDVMLEYATADRGGNAVNAPK